MGIGNTRIPSRHSGRSFGHLPEELRPSQTYSEEEALRKVALAELDIEGAVAVDLFYMGYRESTLLNLGPTKDWEHYMNIDRYADSPRERRIDPEMVKFDAYQDLVRELYKIEGVFVAIVEKDNHAWITLVRETEQPVSDRREYDDPAA